MNRQRFVWLLAYAAVLLFLTAAVQRISPHITSRLATITSLVEQGTFAIDRSVYLDTVDKIQIDGRFYSHQPPAVAVLGAAIYYPLRLFGMRLSPDRPASYVVLTFILNGLATIAGLVFFFRALHLTAVPPVWRMPITASLACATLVLPYSTTLNSHGLGAALVAIGLSCFVLSLETGSVRVHAMVSGLAFSLAAAADHAMLAFFGLFALCLLVRKRRLLPWFLLPALATLVPTFAYYYMIGHTLKPFAARPEFFVYPGSPWVNAGESTARLTGASRNSLPFAIKYAALMLFGKRGFLLYNALACFAIYGCARAVAARSRYWREALAALAGSLAVLAFYAFSSANFSGASYSIRWFVPVLPLWWFFGANVVNEIPAWGRWRKALLTMACALSLMYAFTGTLNQWPEEWRGLSIPLHNFTHIFNRPLFVPY
ncbi:MAG: hypothetical protein ABI759_26135 [Candidatus Solibacter sp.]